MVLSYYDKTLIDDRYFVISTIYARLALATNTALARLRSSPISKIVFSPPPYLNLVILPDGHGPDPVLGSQLLGQGRGHQPPPDVRGRGEVTLPRLGAVRGHVFV